MCDRDCGEMHEHGASGLNTRPSVNGPNATPRKASGRSLLAGLAAMSLATAAHAETRVIYVDASRPMNGDGTSWQQAFKDLQDAFDSVNALPTGSVLAKDVEFRIAQGTYRPVETRQYAFAPRAPALTSAASLTIAGGYGGFSSPTPDARDFVATPTILTADVFGNDQPEFQGREDNCPVVLQSGVEHFLAPRQSPLLVAINGLTLEGAGSMSSDNAAGFIAAVNAPVANESIQSFYLTDCIMRDNAGPGITVSGIRDFRPAFIGIGKCRVSGNRSPRWGGGLCIPGSHHVQLTDSVVSGNSATLGGGGLFSGYATIQRCVFAANSTQGDGGAILQDSNNYFQFISYGLHVSNCLFAHNNSQRGGGLFTWYASVQHCTLAKNSSSFGGGLFSAGTLYADWSIFASNAASVAGSQLAGGLNVPSMRSCAVDTQRQGMYFPFGVTPDNLPLAFQDDFVDADGPDNDADTWADNVYRLRPRSPLVDAGFELPYPDINLGDDLGGGVRGVQGILGRGLRTDLGCYESQLTLCPADIDADGGVTIDDLLDFLVAFENGQPLADQTTNGTTPFPDGGVTVDDLLFFLARFEQGC